MFNSTGTGLLNVRGLLRRPEARLLVQQMQKGEVKPGEAKIVPTGLSARREVFVVWTISETVETSLQCDYICCAQP